MAATDVDPAWVRANSDTLRDQVKIGDNDGRAVWHVDSSSPAFEGIKSNLVGANNIKDTYYGSDGLGQIKERPATGTSKAQRG